MLRGEFEKLLQILRPEGYLSKEDLKVLKDKVFGPQVFFVTETKLTDDFSPDAGWLVSLLSRLTSICWSWTQFCTVSQNRKVYHTPKCVECLLDQYVWTETGHSMKATSAVQVRGNLRAKREDALSLVAAGVEKHFGEAAPARHVHRTQ